MNRNEKRIICLILSVIMLVGSFNIIGDSILKVTN